MNSIVLRPDWARCAQIVVQGKVCRKVDAQDYFMHKTQVVDPSGLCRPRGLLNALCQYCGRWKRWSAVCVILAASTKNF